MMDLIGTELLKTIGAGVALANADTFAITFVNPAFAQWFGDADVGASLTEVLPGFSEVIPQLSQGAVTFEANVKRRRRELVISTTVRTATHDGSEVLVVECQNVSRLRQTEAMIDTYAAMSDRRARELEREKAQVEKLLLNLMPRSVYEEYKTFGSVTPKLYEPVTVLMLDFVGFTAIAESADPTVVVAELNDIFTAFDRIAEVEGCERIKTIGDAYLAVAGLPQPNPDHARAATKCAVKMLRYLHRRNASHAYTWKARIGIATGSVVGSVVGIQKYVYDVFGSAVNRAARLQALCEPMEICVGEELFSEVIDDFYLSPSRIENVRGVGDLRVATVSERRLSPVDNLVVQSRPLVRRVSPQPCPAPAE